MKNMLAYYTRWMYNYASILNMMHIYQENDKYKGNMYNYLIRYEMTHALRLVRES